MVNNTFQLLQKKYSQKSKRFDKKLLKIPLKETGEKFLSLSALSKKHEVKIIFANKKNAFLRKSVAECLIQAAKYFNEKGFTLKIESAYRSLNEQKKRFIARYKSMKKFFPKKSKAELLTLANTYTAGIPILAAHTGGAAVDVVLLDINGKLLDFGVPYPHGDIESVTDYSNLSKKVIENRKLLKEGMGKYCFTNYPFEYWHFSIGDVCAAHVTGKKYAKFGPVNYNFETGKIVYMKDKKELYQYFTI